MSATVKVWDPFIRIFHWSLATSFAVAWLTGDELMSVHEWAGYAAGGLVALRLVMGIAGSPYARFRQFIRGPRETAVYAADIVRHREARYLGHNPVGALMVMALLGAMAALALTGWMQTTDAYWGVDWVEETHEVLANLLLGLVVLHIGGVLLESFRHHENLVRAMITGRKRAPAPGDVI
ncbi:MAG: cytochrome b/b6 domain-containing protein [Mesorhizobium sp.]|nr:cytochrome b/b6 domain-containing protein [Mesorhizobium sp.]